MEEDVQADLTLKAEINLYYDLRVPPGASTDSPLLIAVHGYGAHKRYMMREASAIAPEHFVIASIQGPHQHYREAAKGGWRTGFGWLTPHRPEEYITLHHDFIRQLTQRLADEDKIDPRQVWLFGFSQACALNFRFAFTYPDLLAGLIAVCGGIPGDLETNAAYRAFDARTLYLYGTEDEFYTQEQFSEYDAKLAAMLPNYTSERFDAGHEITEAMRDRMREFLVS
ncbi:MAG TPA: PHB depolymerase family esterase [Pyrinomonadaceae bacterium]|nr:PHB depolymerase family esterase [Pyrinomonadaceae bacterium]